MRIIIEANAQALLLFNGKDCIQQYSISTATNGLGELRDSYQTPRGRHEIREKIGGNHPLGSVFVGRIPTGEVYSPELHQQHPDRDWILSRILWLSGLEEGKNKGGVVDSYTRYIYIHGTADHEPMGVAGSKGCIRMRNSDIVELFEKVSVGDQVLIKG